MVRSVAQLKRKLRDLKRLEIKLRFKNQPRPKNQTLIWDIFFSTKIEDDRSVKYSLTQLMQLDREALKQVFEEYFYRIYFQNYQDYGLTMADVYDPGLLSLLGLPAHAGIREIKQRFRALAKQYHPDRGGESEKFIELVEIYEQLTDDSNA